MYVAVLTVAMREVFNELANRDMEANKIRDGLNQEQWMSNEVEIFWLTTEQRDYQYGILST